MGRRLRSRLDSLLPNLTKRVEAQQTKQAQQHNSTKPLRTFAIADLVYVRDFTASRSKWIPGTVVKVTGPLSYHVQLASGETVRRHVDAMHPRRAPVEPAQSQQRDDIAEDDVSLPDLPPTPGPAVVPPQPPPSLRRSTRQRRAPARLGHDLS